MKLIFSPQHRANRGNTLLIMMGVMLVLAVALAAVLSLTTHEQRILARTSSWNAALPVAEAGVEEAMSHLQQVHSANITFSHAGNGWQASGSSFTRTRNLNNSLYVVGISSAIPPVIVSLGRFWCPSAGRYIDRTVQVTTSNTPLFTVAFGARGVIDINGNGISSDSFDSSNTNLSTNGKYDPSKTSTNGDVASVVGPVDLGNHTFNGDLYLGPTATFVGDSNQVSGTIHNDFNLDFPSVVPPAGFTTWVPALPLNLLVGGTVYKYAFLTDGDYTIMDSANVYVGPNAKVRLRVTAPNFSPGAIRIGGSNSIAGKLTVYMAGASCTMGGSTTVESGNAANFSYFGLPSNTSITYGGGSTFVGTIYAPDAHLTLNGGGSGTGFIGSSITKTIEMNGKYNFHFDENLLKAGPPRAYTMASWREL